MVPSCLRKAPKLGQIFINVSIICFVILSRLLFTIAIVLGVVCIIYVLYGKPWHGDSISPLQNGLDLDTASDEEQVGDYAEPIKSPADPNSYRVFNLSIG